MGRKVYSTGEKSYLCYVFQVKTLIIKKLRVSAFVSIPLIIRIGTR